jgi:hypothetical protein
VWDPYDNACVRVHEAGGTGSGGRSSGEISAMTVYEAWNILVTGR